MVLRCVNMVIKEALDYSLDVTACLISINEDENPVMIYTTLTNLFLVIGKY